jgi:NADPH:quinone reductase-like Zn-dependent oxidoreductase
MINLEYPAVLGGPCAGTIEAIGDGVTRFAVGQRIVSAMKVFTQKKAKYGGLQRFAVVNEAECIQVNIYSQHYIVVCYILIFRQQIGEIPFDKAASIVSFTPPSALFSSLNMHFPTIPASPLPENEQGKKILIWGGSSAMGSLSISYAKQAGYTVITTCSPHNFDLVKSLGADHVFNHSDPATVSAIRGLFPIDYWFDTISLNSTMSTILKILAPEGEPVTKAKILVLLPPSFLGIENYPDGITTKMHLYSVLAPENAEWYKHFLAPGGFIEKGMQSGIIKGVPTNVIGGLEKAGDGIEAVHKGVSGQKVIVEPWA